MYIENQIGEKQIEHTKVRKKIPKGVLIERFRDELSKGNTHKE